MHHHPAITAILGPTNTGKTWYAIERMQGYARGMIGFPLRLLARENYDRLVAKHGPSSVALITGEEKIIPAHARFYCCTVEAMPVSESFEFVAIDEIQLSADPDRGHIFTDRLLYCRGTQETMFLGAETMQAIIKKLVRDVRFETRPRLSTLSYTGFTKLTRLPKRSAIVAFSMDDVYSHADLIRRQKGGAAIVMGALSPRTRNAQVDMYQSGEVDHIVATDAIGMGLNMDIRHVALAATRKFDGRQARYLRDDELAQIAGRAGRHTRDGSFGVTGYIGELSEDTVAAIENHVFPPVEAVIWRNAKLDYSSPKMLLKSLELKPSQDVFERGRAADDVTALQDMLTRDDVMARATNPAAVRLLWEVCQIPDFRKVLSDDHHEFAAKLFNDIESEGRINPNWMEEQIMQFDNADGDVDTLMSRLAHIRTWTYLANKNNWIDNATRWQRKTRDIEDNLSDALHHALIKRFVDKRNSLFSDLNGESKELLAGVKNDGTVIVEGLEIGYLLGLRFKAHETLLSEKGGRNKKIVNAAMRALRPEIHRRLYRMVNWMNVGLDTGRFSLAEDGQICWQDNKTNPLPGEAVATISKGNAQLTPEVKLIGTDLLEEGQKAALKSTIESWLHAHIKQVLAPIFNLMDEEGEGKLEGAARGIGYQLYENLGVIHRSEIENLIPDLTTDQRTALRRKRVKLGPILVFMPELVKPAAVNMRALLWGLWHEKDLPMSRPADGRVSVTVDPKEVDRNYFRSIGYPVFGNKAIRIDMLDRVITDIYDSSKNWQFQAKHSYMEWLGCGEEDLYGILESMGFKRKKDDDSGKEPVKANTEPDIPAPQEPTPSPAPTETPVPQEPDPIQPPMPTEAPVPDQPTEIPAPEPDNPNQSAADNDKPALATFWLKKGKISDRPKPKHHQKSAQAKKPNRKDKRQSSKPSVKTYTAAPKKDEIDDDSPFSVLKQLQK